MGEPAEQPLQPFADMTVEMFLDWDGGGHRGKLELVNGEVRAMSPASATHGIIQASIAISLGNQLRKTGLPSRVGTETPIVPPLGRGCNIRVPGVAITCAKTTDSKTLEEQFLIAEVLSPNNANNTWDSINAVTGLLSLKEVLAVDSSRVHAAVYRRSSDGSWPRDAN